MHFVFHGIADRVRLRLVHNSFRRIEALVNRKLSRRRDIKIEGIVRRCISIIRLNFQHFREQLSAVSKRGLLNDRDHFRKDSFPPSEMHRFSNNISFVSNSSNNHKRRSNDKRNHGTQTVSVRRD